MITIIYAEEIMSISHDAVPTYTHCHGETPIRFAITCGDPLIIPLVAASLEQHGFRHDPMAALTIIFDIPNRFALSTLETLVVSDRPHIVVTENPCVEHWHDLWDLRPTVLLAGQGSELDLATAVRRAMMGERYRLTPDATTTLTRRERQILQLIACGYTLQQIASQLEIRYQSVRNWLSNVYRKLKVADDRTAALYYWGIWAPNRPLDSGDDDESPGSAEHLSK
jgi:DNA-binding NarL/FixJ family response regulator